MELYGTLGPACADAQTLGLMLDAGMTGAAMFPIQEMYS